MNRLHLDKSITYEANPHLGNPRRIAIWGFESNTSGLTLRLYWSRATGPELHHCNMLGRQRIELLRKVHQKADPTVRSITELCRNHVHACNSPSGLSGHFDLSGPSMRGLTRANTRYSRSTQPGRYSRSGVEVSV